MAEHDTLTFERLPGVPMQRGPASVEGTGLLAFWADIDTDYLLRFQEWHNCEHIPERLSIPGFLAGRRYRALGTARTFFMFYETSAPDVLASDAYVAALNRPTPWTQESLKHFRRPLRSAYRKLGQWGAAPRNEAPYLGVCRFDPGEGHDVSDATAWLAAVSSVAGVHRARLYQREVASSSIATQERRLYPKIEGEQPYLALFEVAQPEPWTTPAWREAEQELPDRARPPALFSAAELESYWLEIALYPDR